MLHWCTNMPHSSIHILSRIWIAPKASSQPLILSVPSIFYLLILILNFISLAWSKTLVARTRSGDRRATGQLLVQTFYSAQPLVIRARNTRNSADGNSARKMYAPSFIMPLFFRPVSSPSRLLFLSLFVFSINPHYNFGFTVIRVLARARREGRCNRLLFRRRRKFARVQFLRGCKKG